VFNQVNVDEDPALADLGTRDLAGTCLLLQRHRVHMEEGGRCLQIEGIHSGAIDPDTPR
jgi:hypothetical protein